MKENCSFLVNSPAGPGDKPTLALPVRVLTARLALAPAVPCGPLSAAHPEGPQQPVSGGAEEQQQTAGTVRGTARARRDGFERRGCNHRSPCIPLALLPGATWILLIGSNFMFLCEFCWGNFLVGLRLSKDCTCVREKFLFKFTLPPSPPWCGGIVSRPGLKYCFSTDFG